ncbi:hypothetical protein [Nocardioides bizhenqiangii]|uniref:Uncharacterized protein n=1 Tax=Nocardioides bizhenqiangii TaxID=3095076 RepID=A0ABZ0ZND5_9ACTN|nr:hypothetical protein [Nocardioides sp. HM61]WQQ25127.1 hypothetical protein SHK19_14270 [Nocardioides sp. HM61]
MRRRVLELTLLAYPRAVRRRDGDHLLGLALELADTHGVAREAFGLLRGGMAERRRHGRTRRAVAAVVAATALVLAALTWTATAQGGRVEEDVFSCAGDCPDIPAEVESRVGDGWTCTEHRGPPVTWRCTRD